MSKFLMVVIGCVIFCTGCSWNVQDIKLHAKYRLAECGYECLAYEGYQWSVPDGGHVWYIVKKIGDPTNTRYSCMLTKWQGEYHLYNLRLIDKGLITAAEEK